MPDNSGAVSVTGYKSSSLHTLDRFCIWSTPLHCQNNPPGNEWQLHTFLSRFSDSEEQQVQNLISESKCSQTGHSKKAQKLLRKWLRYQRRNGVKMKPKIERALWKVGKESKRKSEVDVLEEKKEESEGIEEIKKLEVPAYIKESSKFGFYTYTGKFQITVPPIDPNSSAINSDTNFRGRKRSLTLGDIVSGDPTEVKRRRVGSPAPSRILARQLEVQKLEEAIQELEKERKVRQQLVDRYNCISAFRERMLDEIPPCMDSNQSKSTEQFIGDIKADSMLYINNYRQDLDVFIYLYGIDSARVSSLLDHTAEIFNVYATNIEKRPQIAFSFNRLVQYLVVNNFSRQCQRHQREFDNLQGSFLQELSRL